MKELATILIAVISFLLFNINIILPFVIGGIIALIINLFVKQGLKNYGEQQEV